MNSRTNSGKRCRVTTTSSDFFCCGVLIRIVWILCAIELRAMLYVVDELLAAKGDRVGEGHFRGHVPGVATRRWVFGLLRGDEFNVYLYT